VEGGNKGRKAYVCGFGAPCWFFWFSVQGLTAGLYETKTATALLVFGQPRRARFSARIAAVQSAYGTIPWGLMLLATDVASNDRESRGPNQFSGRDGARARTNKQHVAAGTEADPLPTRTETFMGRALSVPPWRMRISTR
jgi:hypothetical protein